MKNKINFTSNNSDYESVNRTNLYNLFKSNPIDQTEILRNIPIFLIRQELSRILFMNEIYKEVFKVHGVIMEFGVRWGFNLVLLQNLRGIYEPYNHNRKIIGFDTFSGFPRIHENDGNDPLIKENALSVSKNYIDYLNKIMACHENESPIKHIKRFDLVVGDVCQTVPEYLKTNPETVISFAYFDLDLYEPTIKTLEAIEPYIYKGSILAFDQLNNSQFPGETIAIKEFINKFFKKNRLQIKHTQFSPTQSYIIIQ